MIRKVILVAVLVSCGLHITGTSTRAEDLFRDRIAPLLERRCVGCHNDRQREGEYSLQSAQAALDDGYILPDDPAGSHLLDLITPENGKTAMPKNNGSLSVEEVELIRDWIRGGAKWPADVRLEVPKVGDFDWWSYKPLARPLAPVMNDSWAKSAIDDFVLAKLNEKGLTPSPPADRRTLIRRVTYDLIGLPPTPEEVATFVSDTDPNAYLKLVERLLKSERYGEHWARHWLDVAKYADSCGYDKDKLRPNAWPYRDYVIRSLNEDKPYSRFVQEQIAGDILFPDTPDGIVGLGFIAAGPWDFIGHVEVSEAKIDGKVARNLDRDDMVSGAFNTFCSLTVQCARCHNHKFDPVTQEHYYGLQSVFAAVDRANRRFDVDPKTAKRRRELTGRLNALTAAKAKRDSIYLGLASEPSSDSNEARRDKIQSYSDQITEVESELHALPPQASVYAAATSFPPEGNFQPTGGKPRDVFVLSRGEVTLPGTLAIPGVLPLSGVLPWQFSPELGEGQRRAKLAEWFVDHDNPLVWRSIVNRIWQYHFGEGIVATPNDLGRMGALPTHPELLDWLAVEFRDGDQSMKELHRMIVASNTYQQSSADNAMNSAIDSGNQFLWRASRRRLSAEELRDSILIVSGAMNLEMGGPGYYLFALEKTEHSPHFEYHKFDPSDKASHRRSIYRFIARSQPNPYMTTLDCADSSQSTPRRNETLTSLQALALLNNKFNLVMAEKFASRLESENADLQSQVRQAMALVTQRPATETEVRELLVYAETHGVANLCRLLFNLSEFLFVD